MLPRVACFARKTQCSRRQCSETAVTVATLVVPFPFSLDSRVDDERNGYLPLYRGRELKRYAGFIPLDELNFVAWKLCLRCVASGKMNFEGIR